MSREVCGICWCPYDEDTGECACKVPSDCADSHQPVAWYHVPYPNSGISPMVSLRQQQEPSMYGAVVPLYLAPPQRKPLTDEEILKAIGWDRAEMYMKLTPNFPVAEAKKETLKNARAIEQAHGIGEKK